MRRIAKARMTLLESARFHQLRELTGPSISALGHLALFAVVTYASSQMVTVPKEVDTVIAQFLLPDADPKPRATQEQISYVGISNSPTAEPKEQQPIVADNRNAVSTDRAIDPKPVESIVTPQIKPPEEQQTFTEIDVDSAAARDAESAGPAYPAALLAAQIEGMALVQFIVDSAGKVQEETFSIISTTRPEFAEAVRNVLTRMKFRPAWLNGKHVSQLVEQPFNFRIKRPPPPVAPTKGKPQSGSATSPLERSP